MTQGTLHAMMGIPGSGKSTVADSIRQMHNAVTVSPDRIREILTGDTSDQSMNEDVFRIAHKHTRDNLAQGQHVIFDATNTNPKSRHNLLALANAHGARKHLHVVDPGLDVAKQRNLGRERVVPDHVLDRMQGEMQASDVGNEGWDEVTYH